jgi:hypothetical protein
VNKLLTYTVMSDSLMVAYVQLVIVLLELQKVLRQELKFFLCSKTTTVLLEWTVPKSMDVSLLHFYFISKWYIV